MIKALNRTDKLLERLRTDGIRMSWREQVELTIRLAIPAILAQMAHILMQYIDASMVGRLGASDSASIGLIATTTWLFFGLTGAVATGFSVQVAHRIGAKETIEARNVLRQAFIVCLSLGFIIASIGMAISGKLPYWLGGEKDIVEGSSKYFFIFAASMPLYMMNYMMSSMLRCSGNIRVPSTINVIMCVLDIILNFFFIFPSHEVTFIGYEFTIYGAGLGVVGAALGTSAAELITSILLFYSLCYKNIHLRFLGKNKYENSHAQMFKPTYAVLEKAFKIGLPIACERVIMCGAQICTTIIVAPLGMMAIAANSFGINAESLCYMPGYGISEAATTLVGQSIGAHRQDLAKRFAKITVIMGISVMAIMGGVMYIAAPLMMGFMSPVQDIVSLGVEALRIEAFAEPMFAAAIVCYGVFVGAGDTLIPSSMNLISIWAFRIPLAFFLAPHMGLNGVWLAMCIELCIRGTIFIIRLKSYKWIPQNIRLKK